MVTTGLLGKPAIAFAKPTYMTVPANQSPDQASADLVIPMILTAYTPPTRKPKVNMVTSLPLMNVYNRTSWGGSAVSHGPMELPKIQLDGTMDTPTTNFSGWRLPTLQENNAIGQRMTYAEFIQACLEGRVELDVEDWKKTDPLWFRDPYGRRYDSPKILDFTASFVENVPGRTTFQMTLVAS